MICPGHTPSAARVRKESACVAIVSPCFQKGRGIEARRWVDGNIGGDRVVLAD